MKLAEWLQKNKPLPVELDVFPVSETLQRFFDAGFRIFFHILMNIDGRCDDRISALGIALFLDDQAIGLVELHCALR